MDNRIISGIASTDIQTHKRISEYVTGFMEGMHKESPMINIYADGIAINDYVNGYINGVMTRLGVYRLEGYNYEL